MALFSYIIFRIFVAFFALVPFRVLYWYSDFLAFFFGRVLKYRRTVVLSNLRKAFPNKEESERQDIANKFYRNLTDIILESIKSYTLNSEVFKKRYKFVNPEMLNDAFDSGQSVLLAGSHYANWEWGTIGIPLFTRMPTIGIYKGLSNKYINDYMQAKRMKLGLIFIDLKYTAATFEKYKDQVMGFGLVSDQSPSNIKNAIWVNFLGIETACLHGLEKYGRSLNYPIIYCGPQRVKRGYYEVTFDCLFEKPGETNPGEITRKFMGKLEQLLLEKPENWLWSHKRWKHKRKDFQT